MNRGISRLTSSQMRARAIAFEECADHLERNLDPNDEDSEQEAVVAAQCRTLARMWGRRADKGPVPSKRRPKQPAAPFWVHTNRPYKGIPEGSGIRITRKWRSFYVGDWSSMVGTYEVKVPKAICSIG